MTSYIVAYELNQPERERGTLDRAIKGLGAWAVLTPACYAVTCDLAPDQIRERLGKFIARSDNLYVAALRGPHAVQAPADIVEWLDSHIDPA